VINPTKSNSSGSVQTGFFDEQFFANPYPAFAQLRAAGPLVPISRSIGRQMWMVTQFELAVQVLKDRRFCVDPASLVPANDQRFRQGFILERSMITVDDPDHARLRTLVSKAFTPRYIESLRPRIQSIADELLDAVQAKGGMDLVAEYAYPLPINVISDMLGIPQGDRNQIRAWSEVIARNGDDPQRAAKLEAFARYVRGLVAEKHRAPQNDLASQLVQIEEAGDRLDEGELLSMVALLIFAGHETTSNLIANGALALLDHPEQITRLKADPSLIPSAVEEMLRFCGPVVSPAPRYAVEDVEIGGQQLHRGDALMVLIASADHDPGQFSDPEELDIARELNRHIAFGQGIHYCLGAPLARLEGEIAFASLLRRMPEIHLAVPREEIQWNASFVLRGVASLPVEF
jgi:cytochrome P450